MYQGEQNPMYQNDLFEKEIIKQLFATANSLVGKNSSCPRIKLSVSQSAVLVSEFAQQLRRRNADDADIYFILLDAAGKPPTWFWIKIPQPERGKTASLSKSELQKLQRLIGQGAAAYGSLRK